MIPVLLGAVVLGAVAVAWFRTGPSRAPRPICPYDGLPCDDTYPCVACGWSPPKVP